MSLVKKLYKLIVGNSIVIDKTAGNGILIDVDNPSYMWEDLVSRISIRGTGGIDPNWVQYNAALKVKQFIFSVNDEAMLEYHIRHDYAGMDIYIHVHWSHNSTLVTGGTATFGFECLFSKGHNQDAFTHQAVTEVTGDASTTQYQHIISEVALSAAVPSAALLDTGLLEVDGLILMAVYLKANNITSSGAVPDIFIHKVDIHYQSTGIGTKNKAPNFYA